MINMIWARKVNYDSFYAYFKGEKISEDEITLLEKTMPKVWTKLVLIFLLLIIAVFAPLKIWNIEWLGTSIAILLALTIAGILVLMWFINHWIQDGIDDYRYRNTYGVRRPR